MVVYLNRGLILEEAIISEIEKYFDSIKLDETYQNFHVKVTNNHPFAELYLHSTLTAADSFPCVVVTTDNDNKTGDLMNMIPQTSVVEVSKTDFDLLTGEEETSKPGICTVLAESCIEEINEYFESGKEFIYGYRQQQRKKDAISIEIWCDNNQLKNELYEQLRLFVVGNLSNYLSKTYPYYDISINDSTVNGQRSNNYNLDFDIPLSGAHISFDVDYSIEQIVLDTEIQDFNKDIIWEVYNHVKGED